MFDIKISRTQAGLWQADSPELKGLILFGHSLAEVLSKFDQAGREMISCMEPGPQRAAFAVVFGDEPKPPTNGKPT